jgi:predicted phosphoribosyltransferase
MTLPFLNREDAGRQLAEKLSGLHGREPLVVLGLPRGGVPVAAIVARELQAPLEVLTVRKLGIPGHEEVAMGAVASGGIQILDPELVRRLGISPAAVQAVIHRERDELARREQLYRGQRPFPDLTGATVVLVDDGIATGATMQAAGEAVWQRRPASVVVAAPVMSREARDRLEPMADSCIAVAVPHPFGSVGQWYRDFRPTTDAEVRELLARAIGEEPLEVRNGPRG